MFKTIIDFYKSHLVRRIISFALVGSIGFIIDGGILTVAVELFKLNPYLSRCISFPVAVTVTWYLNRRWTFAANASAKKKTEYTRYFIIMIIGSFLNLLIYFLLIQAIPVLAVHPIIPLAIATIASMIFNFLGAQLIVFTQADKNGRNADDK